jgi:hypothetical protein
MSGRTSQRSMPNHVPRRPKPAMTESQTKSTPSARTARPRPRCSRARLAHAAGADDRLDEDGGDAIGADALDLGLERLERVVGHHRGIGVQRADVQAVGRDAADRRAQPVGAVVALRARDEMRALRRADRGEVAPGQLGRRVDGVPSARAEEDARVVERRQVGQALGEIEGRAVGEHAERLVAGQLAHLRHRGLDDLVAPVADVHAPQARRPVEVLRALLVPHVGAIAPGDDELAAADGVHVGEGVPEAGVGGHGLHASAPVALRQSPGRRNLGRGMRRHVATTWRCSTSSPRAMRTSLTIVAGNRPCSTTPGAPVEAVGQRARVVEGAQVVGDHAAVGRRRASRGARARRPSRRSVAGRP